MPAKVLITENWDKVLDSDLNVYEDKGDTRTAIYCRNEVQNDPETYIKYLKWVNRLYTDAVVPKYGPVYMFKLGYLPVCCTPSYWDNEYAEFVLPKLREAGIQIYPREAFCLSNYGSRRQSTNQSTDWWVSKIDIKERFGKPSITGITVQEVYRLCGIFHP